MLRAGWYSLLGRSSAAHRSDTIFLDDWRSNVGVHAALRGQVNANLVLDPLDALSWRRQVLRATDDVGNDMQKAAVRMGGPEKATKLLMRNEFR